MIKQYILGLYDAIHVPDSRPGRARGDCDAARLTPDTHPDRHIRSRLPFAFLLSVFVAGTVDAQGKAHPCAPVNVQRACDEWRQEMARLNAPKGPQPPRGTDQTLTMVNNSSWPVDGTAIFYMPYWPSDSYTGTAETPVQPILPKSNVSITGYGTTGDSPYVPMTSTFVTTDRGTLTLPTTGSLRGSQWTNNVYKLTLTDGPQATGTWSCGS